MKIRKIEFDEECIFGGGKVRFVVETTNGALVKTCKSEIAAKRFVKTHVACGLGILRKVRKGVLA